jgi:hypothetical protein
MRILREWKRGGPGEANPPLQNDRLEGRSRPGILLKGAEEDIPY